MGAEVDVEKSPCPHQHSPLKGAPVMQGSRWIFAILATVSLLGGAVRAQDDVEDVQVIVSVAEQRLLVVRDGMAFEKFPISTSKFGEGDTFGSYKTPLGRLRVCGKVGAGLPVGSVMHHRNATGEILQVNARGRDPIVTRILWLEGLESQNARAKARGIYIHGTVEESKIGKPVSYGCVRMKSQDVIALFNLLPIGTPVVIQEEKLPRLKRWSPPRPQLLAAKEPVKPEPKVEEKPLPLPVAEKKTQLVAVKEVPEKPTLKLAKLEKSKSVESEPKPILVAPDVSDRSEPRVSVSTSGSAKRTAFVVTRTEPMQAGTVIRSNGWAEDAKPVSSDALPVVTLKESILFADLPGHGMRRASN
jgi:hypothetical protein